ncbi:MAG: hypothetical protein ACYC26_17340 [Phycisphaerales bacterium]
MADSPKHSDRRANDSRLACERVIWLGMRVDVPADWAMVRHSMKLTGGRLVWMDRRHQRMQLSWRACPSEPDVGQALSDYRGMDLSRDERSRFEALRGYGHWRGLRTFGERNLTRAASYLSAAGRWVEVVMEWPNGWDAEMERAVLESFALEDGDAKPRHWRAFGMEMTVSAEWELLRVDARPADVSWMFSQHRRELIVRKMGMLDTWYDQDARRFVRRQLPDSTIDFKPTVMRWHEALLGESAEPMARIKRWMGGGRMRQDWVWHCESSDALWQVTVLHPHGGVIEPDEVRVDCCGLGKRE